MNLKNDYGVEDYKKKDEALANDLGKNKLE